MLGTPKALGDAIEGEGSLPSKARVSGKKRSGKNWWEQAKGNYG
jgi:hypothetical protein